MIANYNSYNVSGASNVDIHPWRANQSFPTSGDNDYTTIDMMATEFYLLYGSDITFLPRELYKEDTVFGEYLSPVFEKGYPLRMFVEEVEAWGGNGDMYSKFGLQVTDESTMYINKSSFLAQTNNTYPKQGDLVYHHRSQKLFQISHIENECQPAFYLLGNLGGYKFTNKLFAYNHEKISQDVSGGIPTGIPAAIQALDSLLSDLDGNIVPLPTKEFNQNNKQTITTAIPLIDISEADPLQG